MKLETFIKNEVRKYRGVVQRATKNNKANLDVLEQKRTNILETVKQDFGMNTPS